MTTTTRKLLYGDEVQVVSGVMKKIAHEIIDLIDHLDSVPPASPEILDDHATRVNGMLLSRCSILDSLSKLL